MESKPHVSQAKSYLQECNSPLTKSFVCKRVYGVIPTLLYGQKALSIFMVLYRIIITGSIPQFFNYDNNQITEWNFMKFIYVAEFDLYNILFSILWKLDKTFWTVSIPCLSGLLARVPNLETGLLLFTAKLLVYWVSYHNKTIWTPVFSNTIDIHHE